MTQSVTWSLVSNLFKTNLQTGISRFIRNYNATNIIYGRKPRASIEKIDLNLSGEKLTGTKMTEKAEGTKNNGERQTHAKAVLTLVKTLDVTRDNALSIVSKYKMFDKLPRITIIKNYYVLRDADVDKSTLRIHMYALANTTKDLVQKIDCINHMKLDINTAISLLQLQLNKLRKLTVSVEDDRAVAPEFNNRMEYLASNLGCNLEEMCSLLVKNQFLLRIPMKKIKEITELLLDEGMMGENIKKDLHVYKSSQEKVKERIDRAKQIGVTFLKPWMVRCQLELLDKIEERIINQKNLIGPHNDLRSYLISYFNCDGDLVDGLIKRDPKLLRMKLKNLSKVLDFLRTKGYLMEEIFRQPRILHYSEQTLRSRYDKWTNCYPGRPAIALLTTPPSDSESADKTNQVTNN